MEKKNRTISTIGMILGILTIIGGAALIADLPDFAHYTGLIFGADFYTETHGALAAIANRIAALNDTAGVGLSLILISIGAGEFLYFYKIRPVKEKKQPEAFNAQAAYTQNYAQGQMAAPYTPDYTPGQMAAPYTPDPAAPYVPYEAAPAEPPEEKPEAPAAE